MIGRFPRQKKSFSQKDKKWRRQHIDWANSYLGTTGEYYDNSFQEMKINYNLLAGIIDEKDIEKVLNPDGLQDTFFNTKLQHFPLINSKIQLLVGEEWERGYHFNVIVTNPNALDDEENERKERAFQALQEWVTAKFEDEKQAQKELEEIVDFFTYSYKDVLEVKSNYLINHYYKELDFNMMFNRGFLDPLTCNKEYYKCSIRAGEPYVERINPSNIIALRQGESTKLEEADIIIEWHYKSPNTLVDEYYDILTEKDIEYLDNISSYDYGNGTGTNVNLFYDDTNPNSTATSSDLAYGNGIMFSDVIFPYTEDNLSIRNHIDAKGNIRELKVYWKSFRKIKKVRRFDIETGDYEYHFFPETYIIDEEMGEEEDILYINEAWEATQLGQNITLNMRPCLVQYNRISNPSKCNFGFVGEDYSFGIMNNYSIVKMLKPYSYLYDIVHERLLNNLKNNWGTLVEYDFAKAPANWDVKKWMYFAKKYRIAVSDSFNEGKKGVAKGKLVGSMNTATKGVINASTMDNIQNDINLLEYLKNSIGEFAGISKQREGQIANRETVGGVERATLQSNMVTNWYFIKHNNLKKRVINTFIETAKVALKGKNKKFKYQLPNKTFIYVDIVGDDFANADYGVIADDSAETMALRQTVQGLARDMIQNQSASMSSIAQLLTTPSSAEILKILKNDEKKMQEMQERAREEEMKARQIEEERKERLENRKLDIQVENNIRDNETYLLTAEIKAENDSRMTYTKAIADSYKELNKNQDESLAERARQFEKKMTLEEKKFKFDKEFKEKQLELKEKSKSNNYK